MTDERGEASARARLTEPPEMRVLEEGAGRLVGGPRLSELEWIALITLFVEHHEDPIGLTAALESASAILASRAVRVGEPRFGTQLRSPSGLRRRLTVIRSLAIDRSEGAPASARSAWEAFAGAPEDMLLLGRQLLAVAPAETTAVDPSRGPKPWIGDYLATRTDSPAFVYGMRLGRLGPHPVAGDDRPLFKIGWSSMPRRRLAQLNFGFPPGFGYAWSQYAVRPAASAMEAYLWEQRALSRLSAGKHAVGGEFARAEPSVIDDLFAAEDLWQPALTSCATLC